MYITKNAISNALDDQSLSEDRVAGRYIRSCIKNFKVVFLLHRSRYWCASCFSDTQLRVEIFHNYSTLLAAHDLGWEH